jgi:predicted alpha-1,2-mannosidase
MSQSRRRGLAAALFVVAVMLCAAGPAAARPTRWVDPFIGTAPGDTDFGNGGGGGNVQPAAEVPFGMMQFGPRTENPSTSGGYDYRSTTISGFPLTALSGAGCQDYNDFPIMPYVGAIAASPEADRAHYWSQFAKSSEAARPGYYRVHLDAPDTDVQIAASQRADLVRYTFPSSKASTVMVRSSVEDGGADAASFRVRGVRTITGTVHDGGFCGSNARYEIHFALRFDRPFTAHGTWSGDTLSAGGASATGGKSGAYAVFDTTHARTVTARVAISYVSEAGALRNLATGPISFRAMRRAARRAWDARLGRIAVSGGTAAQKRIFYTALYHTMVEPRTASDVDGAYRGFDFKVHHTSGWTDYQDYSGWDVYRSWFPLLAVDSPDVASDFAQSLVMDGEQGGALPKWSTVMDEANVMTGDPGPAGVAGAYAFGARRFDRQAALRLMLKSALTPGVKDNQYEMRPGLQDYLTRGYIPIGDPVWGPPPTTLEYGSSDMAISAFARALGDLRHADELEQHSQNWQNLLNPATGYIQPRMMDGSFIAPFDPASDANYVEGNAAQYTWMVPHNPAGVFAALGGEKAAIAQLDDYFAQLNAGPSSPHAYMGNEPSFSDAWLYNWVGQPWKSQKVARDVVTKLFRDAPGGEVGNDDLGASSTWQVWGAIGLYPVIPGVGGFTVGSPLFPKVTLSLAGGHKLVLRAPNASAGTPYVRSVRLNGAPIQRTWLTWRELRRGATLRFDLGATPTRWAASYRPPSFQRGQDEGIGFATPDAVFVQPGASATFKVGVQNLQSSRALTATLSPDLPSGVTLSGSGGDRITAPPGARREVTLTLTAAADAPDGAKVVDLGMRAADGSRLPPVVVRVVVARPGDLAPYFNNDGISRDGHNEEANFDLVGWAYSADALAAAGVTPGSTVSADGFAYTWPNVAPGQPDNIITGGQTIQLAPESGRSAIGFLGSSTNGPSQGNGMITYTDGSTQPFTLAFSDWTLGGGGGTPTAGNVTAITTAYRNPTGGGRDDVKTYVFSAAVPLAAGKTVKSVTLPTNVDQGALHVFAIAQE